MWKKAFSLCFSVLLVIGLFTTSAMAAETRASAQISNYSASVSALKDGEISIYFSVSGKQIMKSIGGESIQVYKQNDSDWTPVYTFGKSDAGYTTNATRYSNTCSYSGTPGCYYKIEVTVFATDSSGTDSRTVTRYVTARA